MTNFDRPTLLRLSAAAWEDAARAHSAAFEYDEANRCRKNAAHSLEMYAQFIDSQINPWKAKIAN